MGCGAGAGTHNALRVGAGWVELAAGRVVLGAG